MKLSNNNSDFIPEMFQRHTRMSESESPFHRNLILDG